MRRLLATVAALFTMVMAQAQTEWAVVELSSVFLREAPGYDEENGAQELMGTVVKVLERKSYWVKVQAPDYTAWVNELGLTPIAEENVEAYINAPKWLCTAEYSHIYKNPSVDAERICDFTMGDIVRKDAIRADGWYRVLLPSGKRGYVKWEDVTDMQKWFDDRAAMKCVAGVSEETTAKAVDQILSTARMMLGTPYMWGGNTIKYVDCSGLVKFVFTMNGIALPRNCSQMVKVGEPVERGQERPGDLLFFGSIREDGTPRATHVAIYMGNNRFIHSSQLVRINSLDPDAADAYSRQPIAIRRILGHVGEEGIIPIL